MVWSEERELPIAFRDPTLIDWEPVRQSLRQERDRMRDLMYPGWRNDPVRLQQFFDEEEFELRKGRPG